MHERGQHAGGVERLAGRAAEWLLVVGAPAGDPSLYAGLAGTTLALHEAHRHVGDDRFAAAVSHGVEKLSAAVDTTDDCSLYTGLAGVAFTLHALGDDDGARHALARVRDRFDGRRWNDRFELFVGNAGIGLGAWHAGDPELAVAALEPYLTHADRTRDGINWAVRPSRARSHHVAHGTLGIALALATVGHGTGRGDLVDAALRAAADVVGRDEAGPDGFLVPHSDPQHLPDRVERWSYGWCNGPAGDAQVFRLLGQVTDDPIWARLEDRCWHTLRASGLPTRLRRGFWDNSGRCCGTAGVLALACDRIVERRDDDGFADVLVADLAARATVDDTGARWSNHEHRADPPDLDPLPGWGMGNAGILRELLRWLRVRDGRDPAYAVAWPDHPVTGSARRAG